MTMESREELLARRRKLQREMFTLGDEIMRAQERHGVDFGTDDYYGRPVQEIVLLFERRRALMDAMPTLEECGLNPLGK
jgi:hypothetical protein